MTPTRRTYLRATGGVGLGGLACLAGCASTGGDGSDGGDDSGGGDLPGGDDGGDAGGTRPEGTGGPGVSIVGVDDDPAVPVAPTVEVVREAATEEHPPRLRVTLANAGEEPLRLGEGRAVHFEYVTDGTGALVLLPGDGDFPAEPDCWRLTDSVVTTEEYRTFELAPGASSDRVVDLYATPGEDACLPVGEYRFETTIAVVGPDAEPESSATWGFAVVLE
jgi:hypothetical protein